MKTINLREFYSSLYEHDCFCEVPDEVAELLILFKRREEAQRRRIYRNKAFYSLDCDDGIEKHCLFFSPSAESVFECNLGKEALIAALHTLTNKQRTRLYRHFVLDMGYSHIAKTEGVCESSIRRSIEAAIKKLRKAIVL